MYKILMCVILVVGLSGCNDQRQINHLKSEIQFHKMDARTKGEALAILGQKYRDLKREYNNLEGYVPVKTYTPANKEAKEELLPLSMYEKLTSLTGKCKSADNKLLNIMSERQLLLSNYNYVENLIIKCTAFDLRNKLEKGG